MSPSRIALLLCTLAVACVKPRPLATAPIRTLSEETRAALQRAPKDYALGAATQEELGQRFETGLQVPCTRDERLDALAQLLADTLVLTSQLPARSLTQWLAWKEGIVGDLRAVQAWTASGDAELVLERSLIDYARTLEPDPRGAPLRYGVARATYMPLQEWTQIAVITSVPLELDPLPKRVAKGQKLTLSGRIHVKAVKPKLFLDDSDTKVRDVALEPGPDGRFSVTLDAPASPGRRFLEVSAFEVEETPEHPQWMHPLLLVPLHVDADEPSEPDAVIRTPAPNPSQLTDWPARALELYNARRKAAGLEPMKLDAAASKVAREAAQALAVSEDAPPDPHLIPRLSKAGVPTRNAQQTGGRVEFLDESTALSLYSPSLRQALMDPSVTAVGLAYEPVQSERGAARTVAGSAIFVAPVGVLDVESEAAALAKGLNALRAAAGQPALLLDPAFSALAMAHVKAACDGSPVSVEATSQQANALGYSGGLAMTWEVTRLLPSDLVKEDKLIRAPGTHLAVGACQAGGYERVVFLISSKVSPSPTAPAAPSPRRK